MSWLETLNREGFKQLFNEVLEPLVTAIRQDLARIERKLDAMLAKVDGPEVRADVHDRRAR
jgi:hypothetical protein